MVSVSYIVLVVVIYQNMKIDESLERLSSKMMRFSLSIVINIAEYLQVLVGIVLGSSGTFSG